MIHIFEQGKNKNTLLLLHGTGGDEYDLLDIGKLIDQDASVLSVRGEVNENGLNRFFKRLSFGVLDIEDLDLRTSNLNNFLIDASNKYNFSMDNLIAIGYSNGANIASNLIMNYPSSLAGAILLRPMIPNPNAKALDLNARPIYILAGIHDDIIPVEEARKLETMFKERNAKVSAEYLNANHRLTLNEFDLIKQFYNEKFLPK